MPICNSRDEIHAVEGDGRLLTGTVTYSRLASSSLIKFFRDLALRARHDRAHLTQVKMPTRIRIITPATADVRIRLANAAPSYRNHSIITPSKQLQRHPFSLPRVTTSMSNISPRPSMRHCFQY